MSRVEMYKNRRVWPGRGAIGESKYYADPYVAHMEGVRLAVFSAGVMGEAKATAVLLAHRDTGNSSIDGSMGATDYTVSLIDPTSKEGGGGKAHLIEAETNALHTAFPGAVEEFKKPKHRRSKRVSRKAHKVRRQRGTT